MNLGLKAKRIVTSSMPIARCVEVNGGTTRCREPRLPDTMLSCHSAGRAPTAREPSGAADQRFHAPLGRAVRLPEG